MKHQRLALIVVLVAAVVGGGLWWWKSRDRGAASTAAATQPGTGGSQHEPIRPRATKPAPASLSVTITDERGPIGNAAVRLAPTEGEVLVLRTGPDGLARADGLEPGEWQVSASAADHEPAASPPQQLAAGSETRLAITLEQGGRPLSGVVTDATGGPIAGARIDAAALVLARPGRAVSTAVTGTDGRYQMTVPEGTLLVAARSPDYAAQSRYVEVGPAGATADFALVPGGAIEGVVLDEKTRQPVPGAEIDAQHERAGSIALAETRSHRATAGADGRFRLTGLRPGAYELEASGDGRFSRSPTVVGIGVAEQVGGVEILIGAGPVIRGKVVDEAGAAVAGATVTARAPGGRSSDAVSDAGGAFVLEGVTAGSVIVSARGKSHVPSSPAMLELRDRDLEGVIVRVRRALAVKGHVEPRQIAEVRLEREGIEAGPLMRGGPTAITTGADGSFELSPIAPGKAMLTARCPSGDQGSMSIEVAEGLGEVVLRVAPGASIAGKVVDGDGKPVAGITVMAAATGDTERATVVNGVVTSGVQGLTSAAGAYELRGLAPGAYRMSALERGRPARLRGKAPSVSLADKEKKTGVDFAIDRANGVISGVVLGPDGQPLADAWVSVHQDLGGMLSAMMGGGPGGPPGDDAPSGGPGEPRQVSRMITVEATDDGEGGGAWEVPPALTDAQGRFELRGLAHTSYEVIAEAQAGKLRGRASNVTPDATLTIRTLGLTTLSGTVRGPAGPAALFELELEGPTRAQRTFTNGVFELGRVDPGSYEVRVRSSDGNAKAQVQVVAGSPATVDLVLVSNAIVVGAIVDAAGQPAPGVPVVVVPQSGNSVSVQIAGAPLTTGPDGRFRVEAPAGRSALVVPLPSGPVTKTGLQLEAGKTFDAGVIRLEQGPRPPGGPGGPGSGSQQPAP